MTIEFLVGFLFGVLFRYWWRFTRHVWREITTPEGLPQSKERKEIQIRHDWRVGTDR